MKNVINKYFFPEKKLYTVLKEHFIIISAGGISEKVHFPRKWRYAKRNKKKMREKKFSTQYESSL